MKKPEWVENNKVLTACIGTALIALVTLAVAKPDMIGFGGGSTKNTELDDKGKLVKTIVIEQSSKTLWDLLSLVGVPFVLAGLGFWYQGKAKEIEVRWQTQEKQAEKKWQLELKDIELKRQSELQAIETERQNQLQSIETIRQAQLQNISTGNRQDGVLKNYFDSMTTLLLDRGLRDSKDIEDEIRTVARILTLTVLRQLDHTRNSLVMQFLQEARLGNILSLACANLRGVDLSYGNLSYVDLSYGNLSSAHLSETDLNHADLRETDLTRAYLNNADLSGADLTCAILHKADLCGATLIATDLRNAHLTHTHLLSAHLFNADLSSADLSGADLRAADLNGADLSNADISGADFSGAKYDDKTTLPLGFDPEKHGMVKTSSNYTIHRMKPYRPIIPPP